MQIREKKFGQWVEVRIWPQSWEPCKRVEVSWSVPIFGGARPIPTPLNVAEGVRKQLGRAIQYAKALRKEIAKRKKSKKKGK